MNIVSEKLGKTGVITLDRPSKLNAFNADMYIEFARVLKAWNESDEIAVIVVRGAAGNFSSGNDIEEFMTAGASDTLSDAEFHQSPPAQAVEALIDLDIPVVAAVEGSAVGFGATMLLHFDRVVMANGAYLLYPFAQIGVVPEACASSLLAQCVGELTAKKLVMDPQPIQAAEALRLNLVTDQCEGGDAYSCAMEIAERMAQKSVPALRATKRLMRGDRAELKSRAIAEFEAFARCLRSEYTQSALAALLNNEASD